MGDALNALFVLQDAPAEAEVLYEGGAFYFDDSRKWKERYVVVRANYCLDCHDSLQVSLTMKPAVSHMPIQKKEGNCKYTPLLPLRLPLSELC